MSTTQISLTMENGCDVAFAFDAAPTFSFGFPLPVSLAFDVGTVVDGGGIEYEGEYTSTPISTAQVYDTDGKRMSDDFTVLGIPVYRADNEDGVTVTIAER